VALEAGEFGGLGGLEGGEVGVFGVEGVGLPGVVVEGGLGPEGLVGGGVSGRVAGSETPGAVEDEDGIVDGGRAWVARRR
jgi:hypothetical protein